MDAPDARAEALPRQQKQDLAVAALADGALADEEDLPRLPRQALERPQPALAQREAAVVVGLGEGGVVAQLLLPPLELLEQRFLRREVGAVFVAQLPAQSARVEAHRDHDAPVRARHLAGTDLGDRRLLEHASS